MSKKEIADILGAREKLAQIEEKEHLLLQQNMPPEEVERARIYIQRQKQQDRCDAVEAEKSRTGDQD